jgi:hypothetical protein
MLDGVNAGDTSPLPLGRRPLLAEGLTNEAGDHAILLREGEASRVLLLTEPTDQADERERVIVVPFDEDVETRVDGDALAKWIAAADLFGRPAAVPRFASAIGLFLLVVMLVLTVIGGAVVFSWVLDAVGM